MQSLFRIYSLIVLAALVVGCAAPAVTPTPAATAVGATTAAATATAAPQNAGASAAQDQLTVMTHDSFAASEAVIQKFEADNHVKVTFIKSGDAGAALNRAILSKYSPAADVFYGVDNTFLSRALDAGIFEAYNSPALSDVNTAFKMDTQNRALPVDYGDVCINYDKAYFKTKSLAVPTSLEDLTKADYKGQLVIENPATSSTGLTFLLATIAHFGEGKYLDYWKSLKDNGLVVVNGWEAAYYTNFSGSSGKGPQSMVLSYASSPAAEVVFAKDKPSDAPTASILGTDTCFRQVEFVGILAGTKKRALAEKFVDFMLSTAFQEDMPLQMFVYPTNAQAKLPDEFVKYAQTPEKPASMDPAAIAKNRDAWIQAWSDLVLH
jgi:thiamine transport system substrate-binding protein